MEKRFALLLSFLISLLIYLNFIFYSASEPTRQEVQINRVLDGDTVELTNGQRIRLLNINTPEKGLPYSLLAKEYLEQFQNKSLELSTFGKDIYGRTLGKLYYNHNYLNLQIIKNGYAHTYLVLDEDENLFSRAELEAKNNQIGIWEHSEFYNCMSATINKNEEYVVIVSTCATDIIGWTIKDESTKTYVISMPVSQTFTLYSGSGTNNDTALYWGKGKVWNDEHDRIFIRDNLGRLVYYSSYS